jgi:hypothetical protein
MADRLKKEKPLSRLARKKLIRSLPPYVTLKGTPMRLCNPDFENQFWGWDDLKIEYYRDAGAWSVNITVVDGKVYSSHHWKELNGIELIPISYTKWKKSNQGYISRNTKAYTI